jgi:hypothetical protein
MIDLYENKPNWQLEQEAINSRMDQEHRALCKVLRLAYQADDNELIENAKRALNYWYTMQNSQEKQEGEQVALFPDGTWFYIDEGVPQWAGDDYKIVNSQDLQT